MNQPKSVEELIAKAHHEVNRGVFIKLGGSMSPEGVLIQDLVTALESERKLRLDLNRLIGRCKTALTIMRVGAKGQDRIGLDVILAEIGSLDVDK